MEYKVCLTKLGALDRELMSDRANWGGKRYPAGGRRPLAEEIERYSQRHSYSLSRALAGALERGGLAGYEAEVHDEEMSRRAALPGLAYLSGARSAGGLSLALPMSTRVVSVGGDGGSLVGEEKSIVSDLLDFSAVKDAGATVLENLTENISLTWTTKLPVPTWQEELGFSSASDPEFSAILLKPFRVCGSIIVSRQLLIQGAASPSMDAFLLAELSRSCSSQLDRVALYGTGTNNQPAGVKNTPGIWELDITPSDSEWPILVEAERLTEIQNVAFDSFGYITSPDIKGFLRTRLREVGADTYVWEALTRPFSANQVTTDEIFFGIWNQLTIGIWGADVIVNPYTRAPGAQTELHANLFCSIGIRRPPCFGVASIVAPPPPLPRRPSSASVKVTPGPAPAIAPDLGSVSETDAPAESPSPARSAAAKRGAFR